ncbi:MAG: hypothetical protein II892_12165 [Fibrobacter sp.]|nr:hypothetical protein [Fibrobacter sp.]
MKKIALLAGTCTLLFFVACGDDSSTSVSKNDPSDTAEATSPKETDQKDSGCTVKEAEEGFDIICNGDSIDTIHDEETEQGTCHVKDTVSASGNTGVKITCGDSTRVVWSATTDKGEKVSSGKDKSSSSGKKESSEKSSSSAKSEDTSASVKAEDMSSSGKTKSSSSVKAGSSSSSAKTASSSSEMTTGTSSSDKKEVSSSSKSEDTYLPPILQGQAPDTLTCNSKKFTTDTAFCFRSRLNGNYAIYKLCGEAEYDPEVATCDGGTIKVECGGTAYDTLQKVCLKNTLYPLTATEKGIEGVYIGANDTTYDSDNRIVSVKPVYFAKANLLLVKKGEGSYEGVVPPSPGIISKGARVKYHNEMYYDIEADTLDLFVAGDTSGYFYLTNIGLNGLGNIAGNDAYDIARAKLGGKWRLPQKKELDGLSKYRSFGNATSESIIDNHTVCDNIIDPVHKTEVAFPIAGAYTDTAFVNSVSSYRTANTYFIYSPKNFSPSASSTYAQYRFGFPVRPVFTGD